MPKQGVAPGELVIVEAHGEPVAIGFADPASPIAVRVLDLNTDATIDANWVRARVRRAHEVRADIVGTDALRLVHGENDYAPGLVVDRYADVGVLAFDGEGARAFWQPHAALIRDTAGVSAPTGSIVMIEEHGARFEVDVVRGQKTGFFLDQRDNRQRVGTLAAGARVLNLFCYTGGFSIHAALGGARSVTSVDQARPAMETLDASDHELVTGDAVAFLERAVDAGRRWDVVVCDPPSYAPSERARPKALRAYRRLNRLAAAVVEPGGVLVSASCSSHVNVDDMLAVLASAGRRLRVTEIAGAGHDHPVAPGFPEGRYLKCLFAAVE